MRRPATAFAVALVFTTTEISDTVEAFAASPRGPHWSSTSRRLTGAHGSVEAHTCVTSLSAQWPSRVGRRRQKSPSWLREHVVSVGGFSACEQQWSRGVGGSERSRSRDRIRCSLLAANEDDGISLSTGDDGYTGRLGHINEQRELEGVDRGYAEGDEGDVVEVHEKDMMEEWLERGFDPATFEPHLLLEMWEEETEDFDANDADTEASEVNAVMDQAAAQSARARSLKLSQRDQENSRIKHENKMDDDFDGDDEQDIEAVMSAAAEKSAAERLNGRAGARLTEETSTMKEEISDLSARQENSPADGGDAANALEGRAVGIDLGTTNSAVALIVDGKPKMVRNSEGKFTTASVVNYNSEKGRKTDSVGGVLVGAAATERIAADPRNTYSSVKRVIGRTVKEAKEAGVGLGALNVDQGQPLVRLKCPAKGEGVTITPEEVSAEILKALLRESEEFIGPGANVKRAVVAVPAYFSSAQCEATELAGRMAGLDKVKLMREPEAAALAYGLDKVDDELILVFDLGGGTFDVSVLEVGGGIAEVIATSGDSRLGGDDFDQAIADWLFDQIVNLGGNDLRNSPETTRRLLEVARAARERLTTWTETEVLLPLGPERTGSTTLTRKQMEALIKEPLRRIMVPMREAAIMADISLPGDTGAFMDYDLEDSRDAREEGEVSLRKKRKEQTMARRSSRDKAKSMRKQSSSMAEITKSMEGGAKLRSFPQGRMIDQVVLVGGATRMPCVQKLVAGITGVKPKRTVDPDRAVALGAAVYAGILEGEVKGQEVMTAWQASLYRMMARSGMMN